MSLKHPVERGERDRRNRFDRIAQTVSYFASSPAFFVLCAGLVVAWLAGYVFGAGSSYEQATGTAIGFFPMVRDGIHLARQSRPRLGLAGERWDGILRFGIDEFVGRCGGHKRGG